MTMVAPIVAAPAIAVRWRVHLGALAATWAVLLILFAHDVRDLAVIYWESTTFGHCLFVAPIVGWLAWQRRRELARLTPTGWLAGLVPMALAGALWALGDIAGVAIVRHVALVAMLQSAVLTLLGPQVTRGLLFPLGYMFFLVPFGETLEQPMQAITVRLVMAQLQLIGLPAINDGVLITTPHGYFEVAEACSGNKFLIAMIAYGTLVAGICFASWRRRAAFMAVALVVPVLANGVRAAATIGTASVVGVEAATGFDHIVYGWVFFALVMAGVMAIGWRWFDRDPDAPAFDPDALPPVRGPRLVLPMAAAGTIALAVFAAGLAYKVGHRADDLPAQLDLPQVPGWTRVNLSRAAPWQAHYPTADHRLIGRYADARGRTVDLAIAVYAGQRDGHELTAFGQGAIAENDRWVRVADLPDLAGGRAIRMTAAGPVERETVTWYRIGDVVTASPTRVKLETLKLKLTGGPQRAVAVLASAERQGQDSRAALTDFLAAAGPVDRLADRVTSGAR